MNFPPDYLDWLRYWKMATDYGAQPVHELTVLQRLDNPHTRTPLHELAAAEIRSLQSKLGRLESERDEQQRLKDQAQTVAMQRGEQIAALESRLDKIRGIAGGDWGINPPSSMQEIFELAGLRAKVESVVETCGHYLAKPFPCIKPKGHSDEHESSAGQRWPVVEKL